MFATVLLIDDSPSIRMLLRTVLHNAGYSVVEAGDGEEAIDKLDGRALAAIVCDLDMPRASGVEVVESLRGMPTPPAVVVVSGYMDPAVESRLAALPFVQEVLRKPFDLLVFARRVAELAGDAGAAAAGG